MAAVERRRMQRRNDYRLTVPADPLGSDFQAKEITPRGREEGMKRVTEIAEREFIPVTEVLKRFDEQLTGKGGDVRDLLIRAENRDTKGDPGYPILKGVVRIIQHSLDQGKAGSVVEDLALLSDGEAGAFKRVVRKIVEKLPKEK